MDKMHQSGTTDDARPLAGSDAAFAPPCSGFTLRGRRWITSAAADQADRAAAPGRGPIG